MRARFQTTAQKHQSTTNNEPVSHSINYFLVSSFKIELSICVLYSGGEYVIQSSRIIKVACAKFTAHFRYCSVPEKGEVYKKIANLNCICHHSLYMFCAFSLRTKMETINWPNMQTNKQRKTVWNIQDLQLHWVASSIILHVNISQTTRGEQAHPNWLEQASTAYRWTPIWGVKGEKFKFSLFQVFSCLSNKTGSINLESASSAAAAAKQTNLIFVNSILVGFNCFVITLLLHVLLNAS